MEIFLCTTYIHDERLHKIDVSYTEQYYVSPFHFLYSGDHHLLPHSLSLQRAATY